MSIHRRRVLVSSRATSSSPWSVSPAPKRCSRLECSPAQQPWPLQRLFLQTARYLRGPPARVCRSLLAQNFRASSQNLNISSSQGCFWLQVTCLEIDPYLDGFVRPHFQKAGLEHKLDIHIGDAASSLEKLAKAGKTYDVVFIDADKPSYKKYYDLVFKHNLLALGGVLAVDNTIFKVSLIRSALGVQSSSAFKSLLPFFMFVHCILTSTSSALFADDKLIRHMVYIP